MDLWTQYTLEEEECFVNGRRSMKTYTLQSANLQNRQPVGICCVTWGAQTRALAVRGWDVVGGGGWFRVERTRTSLWMVHVEVWQKPRQ